jgi:hypothetical protein
LNTQPSVIRSGGVWHSPFPMGFPLAMTLVFYLTLIAIYR